MPGTTLGSAYVQIVPSAQGIKGSIQSVLDPEAQSAGVSAGSKIGAFAKKALVAAGIGTAFVKVVKGAMDEGAKLQQSYLGGLDTLYGDAADAARAYAREAASAGISMNDYSEQAVSFGAALKSAFGGDVTKAAEAANTAIMDMADNSAKMGTDITSVQMAYQGFAKQNYTMLDNLKLGYGGTKTEMERLLADAQELSGVEYNIDNLGDVYAAIHVIQGELGLTGVAANEAATTFSGSFNAMKAAAKNALGSLALGENVQPALTDLATSVSTFFFGNFIPMLGTLISQLPPAIITFVKTGLPLVLNGISNVITQLATSLKKKADSLSSEKVRAWITTTLPKLLSAAGKLIGGFAKGLLSNLPKIVVALGRIGVEIVKGLGSALWGKVREAANGIRDRFMAPLNSIIGSVASTAASIRDRFTAPIYSVIGTVSDIVSRIKSFFPFSIGRVMSNIQLPHFNITGKFSLKDRTTPSISVSWYAKGGIINDATVFGGIGMGEAGPEAIVPLTPFWDRLDKMVEQTQNTNTFNFYIDGSGKNSKEIAEEVKRVLVKEVNNRRLAWQ